MTQQTDRDLKAELDSLDSYETEPTDFAWPQSAPENGAVKALGVENLIAQEVEETRQGVKQEAEKSFLSNFFDNVVSTVRDYRGPLADNFDKNMPGGLPIMGGIEGLDAISGAATGVAPSEAITGTVDEFSKTRNRDFYNTMSSFAGGAEQYGKTLGSETVEGFARGAKEFTQAKADKPFLKPRIENLTDISKENWFSDSLDYVLAAAGSGVASSGPFFAAGAVGGLPGMLGFGYTTSVGELREELISNGVTDEATVQQYSYIAAFPHAILDQLTEKGLFKGLTQEARKEVTKGIVRLIVTGARKGAVKEGATEAAQRVIELGTVAHAKGGEAPNAAVVAAVFSDLGQGVESTILESGVKGAIPGTLFGVGEVAGQQMKPVQEARVRTPNTATDATPVAPADTRSVAPMMEGPGQKGMPGATSEPATFSEPELEAARKAIQDAAQGLPVEMAPEGAPAAEQPQDATQQLEGLSRAQLSAVANDLGIPVRSGTSAAVIRSAIAKSIVEQARSDAKNVVASQSIPIQGMSGPVDYGQAAEAGKGGAARQSDRILAAISKATATPEQTDAVQSDAVTTAPTDEELDIPAVFAEIEDYLAENEIQVDELADEAVREIAQAVYQGEDLGVAVDRALGLEDAAPAVDPDRQRRLDARAAATDSAPLDATQISTDFRDKAKAKFETMPERDRDTSGETPEQARARRLENRAGATGSRTIQDPAAQGRADGIRQRFAEVLASTTPRSQWAEASGVDPETLNTLIEEAVSDGRMEIRFGKPVRKAAARVAPVKPQRPAAPTAAPAMLRTEEKRLEGVKSDKAYTAAADLFNARGTPESFQAALDRLYSDKDVKNADLAQVVKAFTGKRKKPKNRQDAITALKTAYTAWAARNSKGKPKNAADSADVGQGPGTVPEGRVPGEVRPDGEGRDTQGTPGDGGAGSAGDVGGGVGNDGELAQPAGGVRGAGEEAGADTGDRAGTGEPRDDTQPDVAPRERTAEEIAALEADLAAELEEAEAQRRDRLARNYRITDADKIGQGGPKQKVRANIAAIETLKKIEEEGRPATDEEKAILVKYVGWGAFSQPIFRDYNQEFAKERNTLKALLSPEEYAGARASTVNAHYTSPDVISAMWGALERMGFKGGRAIEPAAGIGHFIGLQPENLRSDTSWTAVELDPISARITKLLYAASDVREGGFETQKWPNDFFDLAISNVPFDQTGPYDPDYKTPYSLHDYFFIKALDKVRPGGIVAFITSRYTLDKARDAVRRDMEKRGTFLGAIRLPGGNQGAFKGNAGTDVTTDIIFLRKRMQGEPVDLDADWMKLDTVKTPEGDTLINGYYIANPDMMLGKMRLIGSMYGKGEPVLIGPTDRLDERIAQAAQNLPENAMTDRSTVIAPMQEVDTQTDGIKEGAFYEKAGALYRKIAGVGQPQKLNKQDAARVRAFIPIRDTINKILARQADGNTSGAGDLRADLNAAYDAFVKEFGPINLTNVSTQTRKSGKVITIKRKPNFKVLKDDIDAYKVAAIEAYDEKTGEGKKAAIFTQDIVAPYVRPAITGPSDALAVSLSEVGYVDMKLVAEMLGTSERRAAEELGDTVYLNPKGERWQTAAQYLSGDVVAKLADAKVAAELDAKYARNVTALEAAQPVPLTRNEITLPFGASYIPEDVIADFLEERLGSRSIKVALNPVTKRWSASVVGRIDDATKAEWATDRKGVAEIVEAALNSSPVMIYNKLEDGTRVRDEKAEEQARAKVTMLKEAFTGQVYPGAQAAVGGWVWDSEDRATRLEAIYNHAMNRIVKEQHDGAHLTFPGLARVVTFADGSTGNINLGKARVNAIWRIVQNGNTLIDHVVGAGKTWTSIMAVQEMKRLGQIRRPMFVVPNHMLMQFSAEFLQAYPGAKLLVATKEDMSREKRAEFAAKAAAENWDGIIITHSAFSRLKMKESAYKDYYAEMYEQMEAAKAGEDATVVADIEKAQKKIAELAGKKEKTVKQEEKLKAKVKTKGQRLAALENKDDGITFEELGVDHITVDEAHLFKNLWFMTRHTRIKGLSNASASQRATDLYIKIRHLEKSRPGRSALFLTGTPLSNTMAEIYTMMRYLMGPTMAEYEISEFDSWAQTFGMIDTRTELASNSRDMTDVTSFSKFVNIPELSTLYGQMADTQTAESLGLERPTIKGGMPQVIQSDLSDDEQGMVDGIITEMSNLSAKEKKQKFLPLFTMGLQASTDPRLVDPSMPYNPDGKIGKAVSNIFRIWEEGNADPLSWNKAQIVFLDMGVPGSKAKAKPRVLGESTDENAIDTIDVVRKGLADNDAVEEGEEEAELQPEKNEDDAAIEKMLEGKFNLYQDMKNHLIEKGMPADQIAFIHDAKNDDQKAKLFEAVREGKIRVLIGSTGKMGVGTNVQKRLIALHHIDAPWRPSDLEQRDGRIVRQGNKNPEVQIYRYITQRSFEAYRWQILERKASFIAQFRAGARGLRIAEDIDSPLPDASEIKAAATGDSRIMEYAELDRTVRGLLAQASAHSGVPVRARQGLSALRTQIGFIQKRINTLEQDASRVVDTKGDNFSITVSLPNGKREVVTERKKAGEALKRYLGTLAERSYYGREIEIDFGEISGFQVGGYIKKGPDGVEFRPMIVGNDTYRSRQGSFLTEDTKPVVLVQQYERLVAGVPDLLAEAQNTLAQAEKQIPALEAKAVSTPFPKQAELEEKQKRLVELGEALKPKKQADVVPGSDEDIAARGAQALADMQTPEYLAAIDTAPERDTSLVPGFMSPEWKAARTYNTPEGEIVGYEQGIQYFVANAVKNTPVKPKQERKVFVLLGMAGSGKSTIAKSIGEAHGAVHIVADDAKPMIPEYDGGRNSAGVHEESSAMAGDVTGRMARTGYNLIIEKIGSSTGSIRKIVDLFKNAGYRVNLLFVNVPKEIAMERAVKRWRNTGRAVPMESYTSLDIPGVYANILGEGNVNENATVSWDEGTKSWTNEGTGKDLGQLRFGRAEAVQPGMARLGGDEVSRPSDGRPEAGPVTPALSVSDDQTLELGDATFSLAGLYHGSLSDIQYDSQGRLLINPDVFGSRTGVGEKAFFMSPNVELASRYAAGDGGRVYRAVVETENFQIIDGGNWRNEPERVRAIIEKARAAGKDGVLFRGMQDGTGIVGDQYAVINPSAVRAFDDSLFAGRKAGLRTGNTYADIALDEANDNPADAIAYLERRKAQEKAVRKSTFNKSDAARYDDAIAAIKVLAPQTATGGKSRLLSLFGMASLAGDMAPQDGAALADGAGQARMFGMPARLRPHARALFAAGLDQDALNKAITAMEKDRALVPKDRAAIAEAYAGGYVNPKTPSREIRKAFAERVHDVSLAELGGFDPSVSGSNLDWRPEARAALSEMAARLPEGIGFTVKNFLEIATRTASRRGLAVEGGVYNPSAAKQLGIDPKSARKIMAISLAYGPDVAMQTFTHEEIHVVRELLTDKEWGVLAKMADRKPKKSEALRLIDIAEANKKITIDQAEFYRKQAGQVTYRQIYGIDMRYGQARKPDAAEALLIIDYSEREGRVTRQKAEFLRANAGDVTYQEILATAGRVNVSDDKLIEETVAHAAADWADGHDFGTRIERVMMKIRDLIEAFGNLLRGQGFETVDSIFNSIWSGEVAKRAAEEGTQADPEVVMAIGDAETGRAMRRDLDVLGYYSGALEAAKNLRQAKGTPEQMLAMLKKEGAKEGEIALTGLPEFLVGKASVTKEEIVRHIEGNRVTLNQSTYGALSEDDLMAAMQKASDELELAGVNITKIKRFLGEVGMYGRTDNPTFEDEARRYLPEPMRARGMQLASDLFNLEKETRWSQFSLDKDNPTYRETVLHLPEVGKRSANIDVRDPIAAMRADVAQTESFNATNFRSGHFTEPNIIGHMMTSMTKHEAKPVFTIDQIQSDWGQKLRDGGVRDEAKIADLKKRRNIANEEFMRVADGVNQELDALNPEVALGLDAFKAEWRNPSADEVVQARIDRIVEFYRKLERRGKSDEIGAAIGIVGDVQAMSERLKEAYRPSKLLEAEIRTAEAATPGNPLVNTTDQWVNTTLRRAIRQAVEANAEYIAIPSGDTVLSYNPGDEFGMKSFYGGKDAKTGEKFEGIVPKNLRKLLIKLDRATPAPQMISTLDSPSGKTGLGKGFTLFKITDQVKESVLEDGQAMFSLAGEYGSGKGGKIKAWHSTPAKFDKFDNRYTDEVGFHFGTKMQAHNRAYIMSGGNLWKYFRNWRDIPVEMDIKNPVRISADPGSFMPTRLAQQLVKDKIASHDLIGQVQDAQMGPNGSPEAAKAIVRDFLLSQGYDAIEYPNTFEDAGGMSYMTLGTGNVRNVNTGEVVYSLAGDQNGTDVAQLNQAIDSLKNALGIQVTQNLFGVTIKAGKRKVRINPRSNILGQTSRTSGGVGVRRSRDIKAIAHEGGHSLELMLGSGLANLKAKFADALTTPFSPDLPMPKNLRPVGFSGLELDDVEQKALIEAVTTKAALMDMTKQVGTIKAAPRMIGRATYDEEAYRKIENAAGAARANLIRLVGKTRADALVGEIERSTPQDVPTFVQERFSPMGAPKRRTTTAPSGEALSEAFARWFEKYTMSRESAFDMAPGFFDAFEDLLEAEAPSVLEGMHTVQEQYKAWTKRATVEDLSSDVVSVAAKNTWSDIRDGKKGFSDKIAGWTAEAYTGVIDDLSPVQQIVRRLLAVADRNGVKDDQGRPISLKVSENPYKIARMFRGSYATGYTWIKDGIPNHQEEKVVFPGLQKAMETIFGQDTYDQQTYQAFGQYLISKRAVAEYDRLAAKKGRLADIASIIEQGTNAWRMHATEQAKERDLLDRRQAALDRTNVLVTDRTRALNAARTAERKAQERIQELRDDLAEAMRAIDDGSDVARATRDRRRRSLQLAERNAKAMRNDVVDLELELQGLTTDQAMLKAEIEQRTAKVDQRQATLSALESSIALMRREQDATSKRGASRPPTLEAKEWHEEFLAKVARDKRFAKFEEAAQIVYGFTQGLLTIRYQAGLIPEKLYQELSSRKGWYVPFMRDMSDATAESVFTGGSVKSWSPFKKFDGSDRAIINPLEILSQEAYAAAQHIAMNEAVGALAALAQKAGPGSANIAEMMERTEDLENNPETLTRIRDIAISMGIDEADATLMAQRMETNFANEDLQAIWSPGSKGPMAEPTLPLWQNGERKHVVLRDPEFAQDALEAMKGMGKEQMGFIAELFGKPARWLQLGVTTHPTFMPRNLVRDVFDAWIKTGALPVVTQIKGARELYKKDGEFLRQYTAAGGILGGRNIAALTSKEQQANVMDMDPRKFRLGSALAGTGALGITGAIMGGPLGGLAGATIGFAGSKNGGLLKMVEAIESMTRLGVAAHAYDRAKIHNPNLTEQEAMLEAAFVARDVFDWNRRGSKTLALVRMITFLNAQIQGLDRAARAVSGSGDRGSAVAKQMAAVFRREHDIPLSMDEQRDLGEAYKTWARLGLYTALLLSLYAMYRDDDRYEDIKDGTKATHSWLPGFLGVDVRLPKAFEWAMPANFIEILWDKMEGRDPNVGERWRKSAQEVMVPPGVPQAFNLLSGWTMNTDLQSIAPWLFGEDADVVNRKIVSSELKKLPPEGQFDAFTSQLSKDVALAMAKAGLPEAAIPSPKMIDFTLRTGGYWGQDIQKGYQIIKESAGAPAGPQPRVPDLPVVGGFTGVAARQSKSIEQLYRLMSEQGGDFTTAANYYKNLMDKSGKPAEAESYLNRLEPESRAYAILNYNFTASDKRRHPLERASAMSKISRDIRHEIVLDNLAPKVRQGRKTVYDFEQKIDLPPAVKTQIFDIMERLNQAEAWNGFVVLGRPGWEGKNIIATKPILAELKAAAPDVFELYEGRVEKAKIEDFETIQKDWPKMREELLRNGADANF